ncbi:TylF/MycF family methyltransferase [Bradyrhizobium ontarionense]|uniref:TylF/MycF family methyltransferase n=1 Tax=Bradyrhizobium ontarionense TaxID=2898149 RepID=A0ABY3RC80_9BRAD|nr:TylF/MycF family methyltransferase [Bradyrhizobium sp. A19]UFZ04406.1 TylF/MycF family methyltransferase [Bradyrhizobium sp. A19]
MLNPLKNTLATSLPPDVVYWMRSVKRAIMSEPPLPWPYGQGTTPEGQDKSPAEAIAAPSDDAVDDGRLVQDIALEKYKSRQLPSPGAYYTYADVLILPAQEIAKTLTLCVQYINSAHVNGDVAEFGTMGGFSARAIATSMVFDLQRQPLGKTASGENPFRILRLFDSFEGLPEITSPIDQAAPHVISGAWAKGGCKVLAAPELREQIGKILPPHRFQLYEGWFADTVKTLPPETRFAMIHFDGDLYQSMMDALVPLFQRGMISTGAIICFDDWNANRAIPTTGERQAWKELVEMFGIEASNCGDYSVGGTRFIIHAYRGIPADPE